MYTQGFQGPDQAEKQSRKTFGDSNDIDKLLGENERLKKNLEKEQFFNKLLDHEIQDLKKSMTNSGEAPYSSDYWSGTKMISKRNFYILLFITLVMAAYIAIKFQFPQLIQVLYV